MMGTALQCTGLPGGRRTFSPKPPAYGWVVGGNDAACVFLLHCEADHGEQTIPNDAAYGLPKILSAHKRARIIHGNARFGVGSLYCDGAGAYLKVDPTPDWYFGTQPWSVDFWANVIDTSRPYLFAWFLDADNFLALEVVNFIGKRVRFQVRYRVAGQTLLCATKIVGYPDDHVDVDGYHHYVVAVEDGLQLWIDGKLYACDETPGVAINLEEWPLYIGAALLAGVPSLEYLHGYIDEFRVMRKTNPFGIVFAPYRNPYSLRMLLRVCGAYAARRTRSTRVRGLHGIVHHPYKRRVCGTHNMVMASRRSVRGKYYMRAVFGHRVLGLHGIVLHSYGRSVIGTHRIYGTLGRSVRGTWTILTGSYGHRVAGAHTVRGSWRRLVTGTYRALERFGRRVCGLHRVENTDLDRYELFYGDGAEPDLSGSPWETFTSLPHETPAISGEGLHFFVVRERTRWGHSSENVTSFVVELDGSNDEIMQAPSEWCQMSIAPAAAASARVRALYDYTADGDTAANKWLIYITHDGVDPDPGSDTPETVSMEKTHGIARLDWQSPEYNNNDVVKVIVRTWRESPHRTSTNTTVKQTTVTTDAPDPPDIESGSGGDLY